MPIRDEIRKCVGYVCADVESPGDDRSPRRYARAPIGTAFLAILLDEQPQDDEHTEVAGQPLFAVTAKHVVDAGETLGNLVLRFNTSTGTADLPAPRDRWRLHETVDVGIMPIRSGDLASRDVDCAFLPTSMFVREAELEGQEILGTETIHVGLFPSHAGRSQNQPIVRFGRISLDAGEEISFTTDFQGVIYEYAMKAFVIEAQSWGGQSGSPVFVERLALRQPGQPMTVAQPMRLLGVLAGHFPVRERISINDPSVRGEVALNAGLAAVVPAERIAQVILELSAET